MSAENSKLNPVVFLDRIKRLYPYGVPQHLLFNSSANQQESEPTSCLLLVLQPQGGVLRDGLKLLVDGICSKGLRLPADACVVEVVSSDSYSEQTLVEMFTTHSPRACVVFGSDIQPGRVARSDRGVTVYSYSLERIANDTAIKREFWKHLQENILPALQER